MPAGLLARLRALWRALVRPARLDADMDDEIRFHIDMQAERLARERHLDPVEARRQAFVAFGGVEKWKEAGRDTRGRQWLDHLTLDTRLGLRMLIKHRSLTLIGVVAMTVAVAIGATLFEVISEALTPALPFPQGERLVSVEFATERASIPSQARIDDLLDWKAQTTSLQSLGAFRTVSRNLAIANGYPEPVRVAEISATAFQIAHTPPQIGRYVVVDDERIGAPPVLVIGHAEWQRRFRGDPSVVGSTVTLNTVPHTVVGVMPDGFEFPVRHQFWTALQEQPGAERRQGAPLIVFGVLTPGATPASAESELAALHQQTAARFPDLYARLRPVVAPYTLERMDVDQPVFVWGLRIVQILISGLLVVVAINLAVLFYARTLARLPEIATRSALGASRGRILAQLFVEAFLLSTISAAAGLYVASLALAWLRAMVPAVEQVPYWLAFDLSPATAVYALVLAALAAAIVGVLPGWRVTGVRLDASLRALGGGSRLRLGPMWTALIVAQVAGATAILPAAVYVIGEVVRMEISEPGFAAASFVVAKADRRQLDLLRRIEAEPGVSAVTVTSAVPGFEGSGLVAFDDGEAQRADTDKEANVMDVDLATFQVYESRVLAGRAFTAADFGTTAVVVNASFARELLGGRPVLGQRFGLTRLPRSGDAAESFEIVGVISDFPGFPNSPGSDGTPSIYRAVPPQAMRGATLSIRFRGAVPDNFVGRLRQIGAEVDPTVPLREATLLTEFYSRNRALWRAISWALGSVTVSVLLLSAAGIYALMSFTVAQRTREIGIRTALGGNQRRILGGIFGRVMRQLAIGAAMGSVFSAAVLSITNLTTRGGVLLLLGVVATLFTVGIVAAAGPARRSLRIQAMDALRGDG